MKSEQDKTLEGLKIAVQMEIDGKEYYLKASQNSSNELGKKLLASLAIAEDIHRQRFKEIYDTIRNKKAWPVTDFQPDSGKRLRTIFTTATEEIGTTIKTFDMELDAVQTAMDMESRTYDFYQNQDKRATNDAERYFYQAVATEERQHYLALLDYYEYLKDPAGWFVQKEHPSLDAG
ncbi:ferritin family protein [Chloroflexota bacterium]